MYKIEEAMENMEFSVALISIWQLVSRANKYIDETQPWVFAKDEEKQDELACVMIHLAETLRHCDFTATFLNSDTRENLCAISITR